MRSPGRRAAGGVVFLLAVDGFEERTEIAVAESFVTAALDELVEEGPRPLVGVEARRFAQEDLEHVLVVLAVEEDLELFERGEIVLHVRDAKPREPLGQEAVVVLVLLEAPDTPLFLVPPRP